MARLVRAEIRVKAAIFRDERLLLLRRAPDGSAYPGARGPPGGHLEEGETPEGALRREVLEETGFRLRSPQPFRVFSFDKPGPQGVHVPTIEVDYLVKVDAAVLPRLDPSEHSDFRWIGRGGRIPQPAPSIVVAAIRSAFSAASSRAPRAR
jgi:8-oxo-dGTP pyrophosphatase MutT (NUDIX family)